VPPGYVTLPGSEHQPMAGSRAIGPAAPDERITATLIVRRKAALPAAGAAETLGQAARPARQPIPRADFAARYGADPADLAAVEAFARGHDLEVTASDAARRSVTLDGTVQAFASAFGVELQLFQHDGGTYRGFSGPIHLPAELAGVVEAVLGLDDRAVARPR